MEYAEAGVNEIPTPHFSSSAPVTSSNNQLPSSHANGNGDGEMDTDPEARRRAREEKKQRKEERAMKRAAKEARRQQREGRLNGVGDDKPTTTGSQAEEPVTASQFEVSVTPDEEVDNPVEVSEGGDLQAKASTQSNGPTPNVVSQRDPSLPSISHNGHLTQLSNARGNISPTPNPSAPSTRNPSPTKLSSNKRPRTENAEAGPSTSKVPKTPKRKTATATTKRTPAKKSTPAKIKEEDPWPFSRLSKGDEDVRARLTDQASKNEFLADKFWPIAYLNRLEEQGILTIKKGKLSNEEIRAVRRHLDVFKTSYRLSDETLVEVIMGKGKGNAREDYPDFWKTLALEIPGRPLRYVLKQVQRMYDPRGRKGPWTAQEDNELIRAYNVHPGQWLKIAAVVDRTEQDCRDRWNKEIANSEKRNTGPWTSAEETLLIRAVKEANRAIGADPLSSSVPWDVIATKMDHQRGPTQCRIKWQRDLLPHAQGIMSKISKKKLRKPDTPLKRGPPGSTSRGKKVGAYKSAEHYTSDQDDDEEEEEGVEVEEEEGVVVSDSEDEKEEEEGIEVDPSPEDRIDPGREEEEEEEEIESGSE